MHNGQFGGYNAYRQDVGVMMPDEFYFHRKCAAVCETLFLIALGEGFNREPRGAIERARPG